MFPSLSRFWPNWTHPLPTHDGALKIDPKGCVTTLCVTIRREHLFTRRAIRQKAHHHPPAAAKSEEYESHPDLQWRWCWWDGRFSILQYESSVQMPFYFHVCAQCGTVRSFFKSYFQAQTVDWSLFFAPQYVTLSDVEIQIKWNTYIYSTFLSCIAVCPLQLSQLSKCGPLLFMAPVSNQTLLDLAQNKSLTLAARIKSSASLHFVAWKYAVQRKQWLLAIISVRFCGRRGLGSRNCGQLGNR